MATIKQLVLGSPAEHVAGARAMFETMDSNKDDKVTAAEM